MINTEKAGFVPVVVLGVLAALAGCKNDGTQPVDAAAANGNLAPVSDNGNAAPVNDSVAPAYSAPAPQAPAYPAQSQQQYPQQAQQPQYPAPQPQQYAQSEQQPQYQDQDINDADYQDVDQVADYAPQPPPPLPEYQQPPCPEPNYLWTPGYWS